LQITGEMEVTPGISWSRPRTRPRRSRRAEEGRDFAELARRSPGSRRSDGGDLGFFTKEQMVPEFSAVAFTLEPGKISDPVKSQFGWHIIKVEESAPASFGGRSRPRSRPM
jgi:peptidyl-prolyl cis-trans isomerase C